jgi:tetratricopeptide (TPR) repeat protein
LPHVVSFRPDENRGAIDLLLKALSFDPTFAPALANAAWCLEQRITRGWEPYGEDDRPLATSLARRAIAAGNADATALVIGGFVLITVGRDFERGLDAVRRALDLNPGSGLVALLASYAMLFADEPDECLAQAQRATALNPLDPGYFLHLTATAFGFFLSGRPEQAYEFARRATGLYGDWDSTYWVLVPACIQLGRFEEAHEAVEKLRSLTPGLTASRLRQELPFRSKASLEGILDGLKRAGLPE